MHIRRTLAIFGPPCALVALLAAACPLPPIQSYEVGAAGGSIVFLNPDNPGVRVTIDIPAGSVADGTVITLATADSADYPTSDDLAAFTAFEFGPSDQTFDPPATLSITYDADSLDGLDESDLRLHKVVGGEWTEIDSDVDVSSNVVSGEIDSFSFCAILRRIILGPPAPTPSTISYVSTDVPKAVPDNDDNGITSDVTVTSGATLISEISVLVNVTHSQLNDVQILLVAPDGRELALSRSNGVLAGPNYENTLFDDDAAVSITDGTPPFTGTFAPEGALSNYDGIAADGTWALKVADVVPSVTGTLDDWTLTITDLGELDSAPPAVSWIAPALDCGTPSTLGGGTWIQVLFTESIDPGTLVLGGMLAPGGTRENEDDGGTWNPILDVHNSSPVVSNDYILKPNPIWSGGSFTATIDAQDLAGNSLPQVALCYTVPPPGTPE